MLPLKLIPTGTIVHNISLKPLGPGILVRSAGAWGQVMLHEGSALSVELPPNVVMEVVEADPVVRGQTASSSYKPGKLENGRRVMIPPHVGPGTRIVVSTAEGSYLERAKD